TADTLSPPGEASSSLHHTALACEGSNWLYARGGYCPEGLLETGRAWLRNGTGQVIELAGAIPECHSPVSAVLHGDRVWIGTERPIEKYDAVSGAVLEAAFAADGTMTITRHLDRHVIAALALSPDKRFLWAASRSGVHRLDVQTGAWTHRYFNFRLSPDSNDVILYLDEQPLRAGDYDLWSVLLALPIRDRKAVEKSWNAVPPVLPWHSFGRSTALWPHYRDALLALVNRPLATRDEDFRTDFSQLLTLVLETAGIESSMKADVSRRLLAEDLSMSTRRSLVASLLRDGRDASQNDLAAALRAAGIDLELLQDELDFYRTLDEASMNRRDPDLAVLCEHIAEDTRIKAMAQRIAADDSYQARKVQYCLAPPEAEPAGRPPGALRPNGIGQPMLSVEAACSRYEIPPGMPIEEVRRRLNEARENGDVPEGFKEVPCDTVK
ncbi:MAG TPA: hypothetical protein VF267_02735, partial [Gammaproteobacteria bacterium]